MARAMWSTSPKLQGIPGSRRETPDGLDEDFVLEHYERLMDSAVIPPLYGTGDVVNESKVTEGFQGLEKRRLMIYQGLGEKDA